MHAADHHNSSSAHLSCLLGQIVGLCRNSAQARKGCVKLEALLEMLSDDADDKASSADDEATSGDGGDDSSSSVKAEGDIPTSLRKSMSSAQSERSLGGVYAADDVESAQKILATQKLVSLIDILHVWKRMAESTSEDGTVSESALEVTEQYLISLMGDFCVWNANEDDDMRGVLEKNALVKLMEMDTCVLRALLRLRVMFAGVRAGVRAGVPRF